MITDFQIQSALKAVSGMPALELQRMCNMASLEMLLRRTFPKMKKEKVRMAAWYAVIPFPCGAARRSCREHLWDFQLELTRRAA